MKDKKIKAVVVLSGGLDSTVNLYKAHSDAEVVSVVTFDYGQKAAQKELSTAARLTRLLGLNHQIINIPWVKNFGKSSLLDSSKIIPTDDVQIDNLNQSFQTAKSVWVPNRNGIFLNIAAGIAESLDAEFVIPGFNKEEAQTFPDNSKAFMSSLDNAFSFSTANKVKTKCYTVDLNKTEIVKLAIDLKVPLSEIWPCYFDYEKWCGECESCKRFARALKENHIDFGSFVK